MKLWSYIILSLIISWFFVFCPDIEEVKAYSSSDIPDGPTIEVGNGVTAGYIKITNVNGWGNYTNNYYLTNGKGLFIWDNGGGQWDHTYKLYGTGTSFEMSVGYVEQNNSNSDLDNRYLGLWNGTISTELNSLGVNGSYYTYVDGSSGYTLTLVGWDFLSTLPIYSQNSIESLNRYITDGDLTGAENYDQLFPVGLIKDIPIAQNLTIDNAGKSNSGKQFTNPITVSWNIQPTEEYNNSNIVYALQARFKFAIDNQKENNTYVMDTDYFTLKVGQYNSNNSAQFTMGTDYLNELINIELEGMDNNILSLFPNMTRRALWNLAGYIRSCEFIVTNYDGSTEGNYSDSVNYVYDFVSGASNTSTDSDQESTTENPDGVGDTGSGTTTTTDGKGNVTVNVTQNNGTGSSSGSGGSNIFDVITALISGLANIISSAIGTIGAAIQSVFSAITGLLDGTSEFGSFIMSGFGAVGENGYLSFFNTFMTFLPTEFITMIGTAITISCTLAVAGAVLHFLRG